MKKILSLIRACMTDNMSLFKIRSKRENKKSKILFPVFIAIVFFVYIYIYADSIMNPLISVHQEIMLLSLFVILTTILTLIEGIYKSSGLLFNCKDDNLLLSLPIKKSTVLFVRIFKFYVFELLYNSLFLIPAMLVYARYINVGIVYYLVSFIAILLLPIIPIVISCIIGGFISLASSKFKMKNIAQIVITMLFLLGVFYASFNLQNLIGDMTKNASNINNVITKMYYPAGAYVKLVTNFKLQDLILFIGINVLLFVASIFILSKIYFKTNSNIKNIKTNSRKSNKYRIKVNNPIRSLIKKEFNRFINSPVFVINAGFGLILFLVISIVGCIKYNDLVDALILQGVPITMEQLNSYIPAILFGLICFASLMSSITSSMISLEGKSFSILKSLPVKPFKIILSKILTAVLIMIPFILIGDLVVFINFRFNFIEVLVIIMSSFILPVVAETIGIIVNLKYPKMDAENDTEIVKQSMSSMIAVLAGMFLSMVSIAIVISCIISNIMVDLIIISGLVIYTFICIMLLMYLNKKGTRDFYNID